MARSRSTNWAEQTGTQPTALHRILRLLATRGVFHEDAGGRFGRTPVAEALRTDHSSSVRDAIVFITHPVIWQSAGSLASVARTGVPAVEEIFGKPFFDHLAGDPAAAAEFNPGMAQYSRLESPRRRSPTTSPTRAYWWTSVVGVAG